jgi:hypothetical protein
MFGLNAQVCRFILKRPRGGEKTSTGLEMEGLQAQIEAQGAKVRVMKELMKTDPASHSKEQLDTEIKELTSLKVERQVFSWLILPFASEASLQEAMEAMALESLDPEVKAKYDLVRSVGEECVTDSELRNLVAKKPGFVLYDGFEPSGRMHIAQVPVTIRLRPSSSPLTCCLRASQGIFKAMNVNKCTR